MDTAITKGAHHIGLTVSKLEESAGFFVNVLGWKEVRRNDDYPAIFVSDGAITLTLWASKENPPVQFNRKGNVGLHHLALRVETASALESLHSTLVAQGIQIEFAPEPVGQGPARHMMCHGPSGIRIEFICPGSPAR